MKTGSSGKQRKVNDRPSYRKPHHHTAASLRMCFKSPVDFLRLIHGHEDVRGKVAWARKYPDSFENHNPGEFHEVEAAFSEFKRESDIYVCLHRFWGWKRQERFVSQIQAFHVDIDYYKKRPRLKPEDAAQAVLERLQDKNLPAPSFIMCSGKGLLAVWMINPVPARAEKHRDGAITRWRQVQDRLHKALYPLGSDYSQKHAAAVCRVPGTKNRKRRRKVRLLWCHPNGIEDRSLDDIAQDVLPPRRSRKPRKSKTAKTGELKSERTHRNLHSERLQELKRWALSQGEIPDGKRDHFLFCAACSLAWLVEPSLLANSIFVFATESGLLDIAGWTRDRVRKVTQTVAERAYSEATNGMNNPAEGQGRYKLSKAWILQGLGITAEEAQSLGLVHLNPDPEQCQRHRREVNRQRQERHRRKRGQRSRADYEANSASRQKPWEAHGMSRSTWYKNGLHKRPVEAEETAISIREEQTRKVA
ncbi:hypothetical protein [Fodinicurvata sediminis]|uniref:hypothetical protein n=1 Tax=Fodinicurvata sediminis TaxID=1121832 RepID=UPI000410F7F6|nr:hypothetical protein [Fodinicurvata sediminis]